MARRWCLENDIIGLCAYNAQGQIECQEYILTSMLKQWSTGCCRTVEITFFGTLCRLQCSWLGGFVWKGVVFLIFPPFFQDRFGLLGISWRGSQAVKSTQTEDLEEIVGEGDAEGDQNQGKEEEEEVKGKKSILASKLAKLLSFNQWQLVKSYLSEWQVMERREIGLQKTEQILRLPACHLSQHWCKLVIFTNLASTE